MNERSQPTAGSHPTHHYLHRARPVVTHASGSSSSQAVAQPASLSSRTRHAAAAAAAAAANGSSTSLRDKMMATMTKTTMATNPFRRTRLTGKTPQQAAGGAGSGAAAAAAVMEAALSPPSSPASSSSSASEVIAAAEEEVRLRQWLEAERSEIVVREQNGDIDLVEGSLVLSLDDVDEMELEARHETEQERQRLAEAVQQHRINHTTVHDQPEELLEAVRASLRAKVDALAEDNWMFEPEEQQRG